MGQDYYAILGVKREAPLVEINKAYRRLALKYHPLKNVGVESIDEKFELICEAYEILSDHVKRAIFDKFGEDGLKSGVPIGNEWTKAYTYHGDAYKTFKNFFGGENPFEQYFNEIEHQRKTNFGGPDGRGQPHQDPAIERELYLTLEEIYNGCVKKMKISRRIMNEDGTTSSIRDKVLTVTVYPGWKEGTRITFAKEGDQGPNTIPADIVFILLDKPHEHFRREGCNLIFTATVPLGQALIGCFIDVPTLDGRLLHVPITEVIRPGYEKLVSGEGMPLPEDTKQKGDLIIRFNILFPARLKEDQKLLIEQALFPKGT